MNPDLSVGVLSFLGAALGAGLGYWGAHVATGQRERQSRREEWGRRFTSALSDLGSAQARRRALGRALLAQLAKSDLASQEEHELADHLLLDAARLSEDGTPVDELVGDTDLDAIFFVEANQYPEWGDPDRTDPADRAGLPDVGDADRPDVQYEGVSSGEVRHNEG